MPKNDELCPFACRCHEAADEIERLRAGLRAIIVADQIAGAAPPHVTLRRLPEFNVETWDGPHAALARQVLEQRARHE
jgi:hypothetical protein